MHIGTRNALTFASGTDILNVLLRLVQTKAIMLRPVTSQVNFIEKKKKFQLIAMHWVRRWSQQNRCSLDEPLGSSRARFFTSKRVININLKLDCKLNGHLPTQIPNEVHHEPINKSLLSILFNKVTAATMMTTT